MPASDQWATFMSVLRKLKPWLRYFSISAAVILSTPLMFIEFSDEYPQANEMASVAVLMSVLWIFEPIPLPITALIPLILFPIYGIASANAVSAEYLNDSTFLFFGGFVVAKAVEKYDLHRRIALLLLSKAGNRPELILLAFMLTTGFLSMWISNTATAALMVPILLSLLQTIESTLTLQAEEEQVPENASPRQIEQAKANRHATERSSIKLAKDGNEPQEGEIREETASALDPAVLWELRRYGKCLLLGVAFSASLGGIATLIGTVPNLNFTRNLAILYPTSPEISFLAWMGYCTPLCLFMIICIWLYFISFMSANAFFSSTRAEFELPGGLFVQQYIELGKVTVEQIIVSITVLVMIVLWFTRLGFGTSWFPGWSQYLPEANYGTVAIMMCVLLFVFPSPSSGYKLPMLEWSDLAIFPWDIILLLGGGYALAFGFTSSGLSDWIATAFESFESLNPILVVFLVCTITTFLTELTSNTAVSSIFLPIIGTLAVTLGQNPLLLMIPCTISSSMAFMFPVATPPNAIAFASGMLTVEDMAKPGFVFNCLAIVLTSFYSLFAGRLFFDVQIGEVPAWAQN